MWKGWGQGIDLQKGRHMAEGSKAKTAAKGAAAYYAVKKLVKGALAVAGVAAVVKVLKGDRGK